jgi:hypothetical protein
VSTLVAYCYQVRKYSGTCQMFYVTLVCCKGPSTFLNILYSGSCLMWSLIMLLFAHCDQVYPSISDPIHSFIPKVGV